MSKNSFRIDDILSGNASGTLEETSSNSKQRLFNNIEANFSQHEANKLPSSTPIQQTNNSIDQNTDDLQRTLYFLLNQQMQAHTDYTSKNSNENLHSFLMASLKQNAQYSQINQTLQEQYLADYYAQFLNLSRPNSGTTKDSWHQAPVNEDSYQLAKRFRPSSPLANKKHLYSQDQFQSLLINKYLHPTAQNLSRPCKEKDTKLKGYSYSSPSSTASSSMSSLSGNSNLEVFNSSPRSLISSSDDTGSSSASNSTENVSPLDALLHLANNTFNHHHHQHQHLGGKATGLMEEVSLMNNLQNFKKSQSLYANDENVLLANDLLHESTRTSHNNSFDSSLNGSTNKFSRATSGCPVNRKQSPSHSPSTINQAAASKRKRKNRTAFTANQIFELEKRFSNQRYLSPHDRDRIAYELSLSTAQVITWFQNRRAKQKRDIEEMKNDLTAAKIIKCSGGGSEGGDAHANKSKSEYCEESDNEFNSDDDVNVSISSSSQVN